jgi:CubicO group peptidase (beta-lactamase class C family)
VVVVHRGRIIAEQYADGITADMPLLGWSMTKSVMNAVIGIAVRYGKLVLEDPAPVPEWQEPGDPRGAITVDELLRMSSALEFDEDYGNPFADVNRMLWDEPSAGGYAATLPLAGVPDTEWQYASGTTNILSRVVRDVIGEKNYLSFPRRALFNRLGMRSAVLCTDAAGNFIASSFMYATARDWARFGLLYLRDGIWEGQRVLPEGWVKYSTTATPRAPKGRYGAHFWLNDGDAEHPADREYPLLPRDLYHASGFQGQDVMVIPSRDLVIVRLGMTNHQAWGAQTFVKAVLKALPE